VVLRINSVVQQPLSQQRTLIPAANSYPSNKPLSQKRILVVEYALWYYSMHYGIIVFILVLWYALWYVSMHYGVIVFILVCKYALW